MDIIMPVLLGLERICADEVLNLGYPEEKLSLEDGLVRLHADGDMDQLADTIADLNVKLSTAERVELEVFSFEASDFNQFFDRASSMPWEDLIPESYVFTVNGYSRRSQLFSVTDLQRLLKKAIVNRLLEKRYPGRTLVPERSEVGNLAIKFAFLNDICSLRLDTSGAGLHKRGYRLQSGIAPLRETLAAALIRISRWEPFSDEALLDPFCGSGTIVIEGALMAAGAAPGMNRFFSAETWPGNFPKSFLTAKETARDQTDFSSPDSPFIFGFDIDAEVLHVARSNAERAGVSSFIDFRSMDAGVLTKERLDDITNLPAQQIVTNPPYGERMMSETEAALLHSKLAKNLLNGNELPKGLRLGLISSADDFERDFGRFADKRRKLYNGMIQCTYYQYFRRYPRRK